MSDISTAVIVNVSGVTLSERKLSVVSHASFAAQLALCNSKGAVGKAARAGTAKGGMELIIKAASKANYRPLAEYIAAELGEAVVISNRASFESLPDQFEQRILKIRSSKNGGYREDKNGVSVPTAQHSLMMRLKAECVDVIRGQEELRAVQPALQGA